uniref:Uncharacterized protein n=1 Tax=Solanum lycopersicum TaxID=4081 RepID=A0A3Q7GDQ5_SOLLC
MSSLPFSEYTYCSCSSVCLRKSSKKFHQKGAKQSRIYAT